MSLILYETSTRTSVKLVKDNESFRARLIRGETVNSEGVPLINRDSMILHQYEIYVLDSTKSGSELRTKDSGVYGRILQPLFDDLFQVQHEYIATTTPTSIAEFSSGLKSQSKPILMIIVAGDTSIGEFVNSLSTNSKGSIRIFVIPAGTGNSLALSLGVTDEAKAVQRLFTHTNENVSPFHLYSASFPEGSVVLENTGKSRQLSNPILFVVVASWAFHASLVADSDSEAMRKHGIGRFKVAAHQNLSRRQEYDGELIVSDKNGAMTVHKGPFAYLVITPSQKFEPTFKILPKGNIYNSDLYVVGFKTEENSDYILDIMKKVYDNGSHVADKRVFYDQVNAEMTITLLLGENRDLQKRRFCIDGATVIVPDVENSSVIIGYYGSRVNEWHLSIVS